MHEPFVLVSGLPGSGKTTLARQLAPALGLPVIDKDDLLDGLFESKGTGDSIWRRRLSRESDRLLRESAQSSGGAVLVSFWHLPGLPEDSGTPTDWIAGVSSIVVNVRCICSPHLAAARFIARARHPGHLDGERAESEILEWIDHLHRLGPLGYGHTIDVDTVDGPTPAVLAREIRRTLNRLRARETAG